MDKDGLIHRPNCQRKANKDTKEKSEATPTKVKIRFRVE